MSVFPFVEHKHTNFLFYLTLPMFSVCQIDELISDALRCETVSKRGKQEIESFNGFLSDTKHSLKVCTVIKLSISETS
jgi:hypothetical protein